MDRKLEGGLWGGQQENVLLLDSSAFSNRNKVSKNILRQGTKVIEGLGPKLCNGWPRACGHSILWKTMDLSAQWREAGWSTSSHPPQQLGVTYGRCLHRFKIMLHAGYRQAWISYISSSRSYSSLTFRIMMENLALQLMHGCHLTKRQWLPSQFTLSIKAPWWPWFLMSLRLQSCTADWISLWCLQIWYMIWS